MITEPIPPSSVKLEQDSPEECASEELRGAFQGLDEATAAERTRLWLSGDEQAAETLSAELRELLSVAQERTLNEKVAAAWDDLIERFTMLANDVPALQAQGKDADTAASSLRSRYHEAVYSSLIYRNTEQAQQELQSLLGRLEPEAASKYTAAFLPWTGGGKSEAEQFLKAKQDAEHHERALEQARAGEDTWRDWTQLFDSEVIDSVARGLVGGKQEKDGSPPITLDDEALQQAGEIAQSCQDLFRHYHERAQTGQQLLSALHRLFLQQLHALRRGEVNSHSIESDNGHFQSTVGRIIDFLGDSQRALGAVEGKLAAMRAVEL